MRFYQSILAITEKQETLQNDCLTELYHPNHSTKTVIGEIP